MAKLNPKQHRFVEEYLIDLNATQAAIRAGYSAKMARFIGAQNLTKLNIQAAINDTLNKMRDAALADAYEVEKYLTDVLRGKSQSEVVVVEFQGEGCSKARRMSKSPDEKERLKAAEILAKRHGLTDAKLTLQHLAPPVFSGENDLE